MCNWTRWLAATALFFAFAACTNDKQKAARERAEIEKRIQSSFTLVPYRAMKTVMRSSKDGARPKELDEAYAKLKDATDRFNADVDANRTPLGPSLELLVGAYRMRAVVNRYDEDTFTTLWHVPVELKQYGFYDNGAEHLAIGVLWTTLAILDQSGKIPAPDVMFYELSRAAAKDAWPWPMRVLGRALRGMAQCHEGFHFAAEEELTALIDEVERATTTERSWLMIYGQPDNFVDAELRATSHLLRAWNRFGLGRRDGAADDIEAALQQLDKIGVDNELTQWGWAIVHARRGRTEESAKKLEQLAKSTYLDATARAEVEAAAKEVRSAGKDKLPLTSMRAQFHVAAALIGRAGGLDHIIEVVLGPEVAAQVRAPTQWVRAMQHSAADLVDEKQIDAATAKLKAGSKELLDKAGDLGKQGLEKGKGLLDKLTK